MIHFLVERVPPAGWRRVRDLLLRARQDSPDAFGTTYAQEAAKPLDACRDRVADTHNAAFIAIADRVDVGIVHSSLYRGREDAVGLFGMWVAPTERGGGIGGALVKAVVGWARSAGHHRVLLHVEDANDVAIGLYAKHGFEPTGRTGTSPAPREHILEHERELRL